MTFSRLWIHALAVVSASIVLSSYPASADSNELTSEADARAALKAINDEIATLEHLITSQSKERMDPVTAPRYRHRDWSC